MVCTRRCMGVNSGAGQTTLTFEQVQALMPWMVNGDYGPGVSGRLISFRGTTTQNPTRPRAVATIQQPPRLFTNASWTFQFTARVLTRSAARQVLFYQDLGGGQSISVGTILDAPSDHYFVNINGVDHDADPDVRINSFDLFTLTYNGTTGDLRLIVNDDGSTLVGGIADIHSAPTPVVRLGASNDAGADPFIGDIGDVRIYGRRLATSEITDQLTGVQPEASELLAHWGMQSISNGVTEAFPLPLDADLPLAAAEFTVFNDFVGAYLGGPGESGRADLIFLLG